MEKKTQFDIWYFVAAFLLLLLFQIWWAGQRQVETISFSTFKQDLSAGLIKEVVVRGDHINGTYKEPRQSGKTQFITQRVPPDLEERLSAAGVDYGSEAESTWLRDLLPWVLPVLLFFVL